MKIRDLLVIIFTAIVALLLFIRAARADASCPEDGAEGSDGDGASSPGEDVDAPVDVTDWMCSDACASICGASCGSACAGAADAGCLLGCYPTCAESCYLDCGGAQPDEAEPEPVKLERATVPDLQHVGDDERPSLSRDTAGDMAHAPSLSCGASPGAATATVLDSLAAFLAVGLVARRRRR